MIFDFDAFDKWIREAVQAFSDRIDELTAERDAAVARAWDKDQGWAACQTEVAALRAALTEITTLDCASEARRNKSIAAAKNIARAALSAAPAMSHACDTAPGKRLIDETQAAPAATGTRDIEVLAANVHDQWIEAKRAQGITSRRSESGEELMVAYPLLSEPQKEMDRTLVRTVLRAIDASAPSPAPHAEAVTERAPKIAQWLRFAAERLRRDAVQFEGTAATEWAKAEAESMEQHATWIEALGAAGRG